MAPPLSTPHEIAAPRRLAAVTVAVGATVAAVLFLAAAGLWFHYGTAVFFEMIASGFSACF